MSTGLLQGRIRSGAAGPCTGPHSCVSAAGPPARRSRCCGRTDHLSMTLLRYPCELRFHVCQSAGQIGATSKPAPLCRKTNWSGYSQAQKRRGSLPVWLDPGMSWFAAPNGKAGHSEWLSAAAVRAALINRYNNHRCHESAGNLSPATAVVVVTRTSWPKGDASDCILPQTAA